MEVPKENNALKATLEQANDQDKKENKIIKSLGEEIKIQDEQIEELTLTRKVSFGIKLLEIKKDL